MAETEERGDRWRLGKDIPVALVFAIILQTLGMVWWASNLASEVREIGRRLTLIEVQTNANMKAMNEFLAPSAVAAVRIDTMRTEIFTLRSKVDALEEKLASVKR